MKHKNIILFNNPKIYIRFGSFSVYTHPFRKAIRLYVENLLGYKYQGINYKKHVKPK